MRWCCCIALGVKVNHDIFVEPGVQIVKQCLTSAQKETSGKKKGLAAVCISRKYPAVLNCVSQG